MLTLVSGLLLQGGMSIGKTTTDNCEILQKLPENVGSTSTQFCHVETPWLPQYKFGGSYTLPWDIQVSGTLQSFRGAPILASATFTNAQIAPSLGRNLSQGTTATVGLVQPNSIYLDRINQVDIRFAKVLTFGRTRANVGVDLYNALNTNVATAYNQTYGPAWLTPTAIMPARFIKFNAQFDW